MIPLSREPLSANRRHVVGSYTAAFALLAESVNRHQQRRDREKNAEKFDVRHRASPRFQHLYAKAGCHRVSPLGYCISIPYSGKNGKAFTVFAGVGGCRQLQRNLPYGGKSGSLPSLFSVIFVALVFCIQLFQQCRAVLPNQLRGEINPSFKGSAFSGILNRISHNTSV